MFEELSLKDMLIISKMLKVGESDSVLNVGCGNCRICWHMNKIGYKVISTDYETTDNHKKAIEPYKYGVDYHNSCNIFDLSSFPVQKADIVLCSEVVEHLVEYKTAFKNLLELANKRVIITTPYIRSFNHPAASPEGHCNWWNDDGSGSFSDIQEFIELSKPYSITIERGITKVKDYNGFQRAYIMVIDKTKTQEGDVVISDISGTQLDWSKTNTTWNPNE